VSRSLLRVASISSTHVWINFEIIITTLSD